MKIVNVTYITKLDFIEQNKENIRKVMSDLQQLNYQGINYNVCLMNDSKTFIHTAFFKSDSDQLLLNEMPAFKLFQQALKESGLESPPRQELLTLVSSSKDIF